LNKTEEPAVNNSCFTNFDGKFKARLAAVMPRFFGGGDDSKVTGTSARYQCRVKIKYQKDLMGLLEEGMLLAVKNFKPAEAGPNTSAYEDSAIMGIIRCSLRLLNSRRRIGKATTRQQ
jgi:hypothetical protein